MAVSVPRHQLVLAPSDSRGWFGGRTLEVSDPVATYSGLSMQKAAMHLERAFDSPTPVVVAAILPYDGTASVNLYEGCEIGDETQTQAEAPVTPAPQLLDPSATLIADSASGMDATAYQDGVERTRERIAAGYVYVLNLTYRISGLSVLEPAAAFGTLQSRAHSAMSALFVAEDCTLASVSPERFLAVDRVDDGARIARVEPIKGTRPRYADPDEDAAAAAELLASEKERAEHVMIVDLVRNDLGSVSLPGSVDASELFEVFPTPYCHQMVSTVRSVLRPETRLIDLLEATFPCGSVTGAPKISAMGIIDDLERSKRGAYTGALVVATPGHLDSSILIRTLEYRGEHVAWGTGGGITYDSNPVEEWEESLLKARPALGTP